MVENRQWSAPSLEQALELVHGILPREFQSWEELPGRAWRLLPTPEASDGSGGRVSAELGGTRPSGAKRAVTLASRLAHLLPTPTASDGMGGTGREGGEGGPNLRTLIGELWCGESSGPPSSGGSS
jgi:hypothetical protein